MLCQYWFISLAVGISWAAWDSYREFGWQFAVAFHALALTIFVRLTKASVSRFSL